MTDMVSVGWCRWGGERKKKKTRQHNQGGKKGRDATDNTLSSLSGGSHAINVFFAAAHFALTFWLSHVRPS